MINEKDLSMIKSLDLAPEVEEAAKTLKTKQPSVIFTSGRRTVQQQAHSMATNLVASGNRKWIAHTYLAAKKLQDWVDSHPAAITVQALSDGLEATMKAMPQQELVKISRHLTGQAFDISPPAHHAAEIEADIRSLKHFQKFLKKEGNLIRWHVQFS